MRHLVRLLLMLLFGLLCRGPVLRAGDVDSAVLDKIIGEAVQTFEVPGAAVVVVQDDRVAYIKGFGVRKLGAKEEVTPDTVFALASCTKAFTATGVALLVAEKKMNWDDPVRLTPHLPAPGLGKLCEKMAKTHNTRNIRGQLWRDRLLTAGGSFESFSGN